MIVHVTMIAFPLVVLVLTHMYTIHCVIICAVILYDQSLTSHLYINYKLFPQKRAACAGTVYLACLYSLDVALCNFV